MKKINFTKPKYVLPIPILLFMLVGFWAYRTFAKEDSSHNPVAVNGINANIPDPVLDDKHDQNKIQAFTKNLLHKSKDKSFVKEVGLEEDAKIPALTLEGNLTEEERKKLDSLRTIIKKDAERRERTLKSIEERGVSPLKRTKSVTKKTLTKKARKKTAPKRKKTKNDEMEEFRQQVRIMDSIQNPEKYIIKKPEIKVEENTIAQLSKTTSKDNSFFNTVKENVESNHMMAILDEGLKVYQGSRVRIRLMQDVFISDQLLKKGQYLYGIVNGFSGQRVEVKISSIKLKDTVVPVDITVYDIDGIEGLYVPDSNFRDFVKELGIGTSTAATNLGRNNGNVGQQTTQALFQSVTNAVRSTTRAIEKNIRKNKARLKYNTQVILINTKN